MPVMTNGTLRIVNRCFSHSFKFLVLTSFLMANPFSLVAYEINSITTEVVEKYPHILKCDTSCHKIKNIILAKKSRTTRSECQECHVGVVDPPSSPFLSFEKFLPPGDFTVTIKPQQKLSPPTAKTFSDHYSLTSSVGNMTRRRSTPMDTSLMTLIPGGEFIMGSNERWDDEAPEYIESVDKFYIDLYEVTNAEYEKFTEDTKRKTPYHWPNGKIPEQKDKHPVVYVSWHDANEYCKWKGKRLPTEQEWEKGARGESGNIYPWGNTWTLDRSNHPYKGSKGTETVGSYPNGKSPYGLYDMSGNVWEWVDSFYLPHPGNNIDRGEYGTDKRVLKGGSWFDCLSYGCGLSSPTFNRSFFTPEVKNNSFGFRCAKSP